jgi:hypothetical protein
MSSKLTIAVVGAGGKMGTRVSNNLAETDHTVYYAENFPPARQRVQESGRTLTDTDTAVVAADVVILAVPDRILGAISHDVVPKLRSGAIVLTLDPAAAYAGLLAERDDVSFAVAHPCHPSVFLERTSKEEWADTFGGIAAPQDVVAAQESGTPEQRVTAETVIRAMYAPVLDVHWVTVKQLAVLEPTLVETVACMIGALLNEALHETVHTVGVPESAAKAMLYGHVQVALANGLRGDHPFSEACLIAMDYGRATIVKEDWKKIFDDSELDGNIARMLHLDGVRTPAHS